MKKSIPDLIAVPVFIIGFILYIVSHKYLVQGDLPSIVRGVAALLMLLGGLGATLLARSRAMAQDLRGEAKTYFPQTGWMLAILAGVGFWEVYTGMVGQVTGDMSVAAILLLGVSLVCFTLGIFSSIGVILGRLGSGRGTFAEPERVSRIGSSWLLVGLVFVTLAALNYTGVEKNVAGDWSYFKTTEPGESSRKMVANLDDTLDVALFFPRSNEVLPMAQQYFTGLAGESDKVKVAVYDKEMNPAKADEFKVTKNGKVVLRYKDQRQRIEIGEKLKSARNKLRELDELFQKAFLKLTSKKAVAYFTRGHGEMDWQGMEKDPMRELKSMGSILRSQNFGMRFFGGKEGGFDKVPDDATVVIIAGPTEPFLAEEVRVLEEWLDKGGQILVMLDPAESREKVLPGETDPLAGLIEKAGISFVPDVLANDKSYVASTRSPADHWFLYTNIFGAHDSVLNLSKNDSKIQLLFMQAGYLQTREMAGWKSFETVQSRRNTFVDKNRNYKYDKEEGERRSLPMAVIAEKKLSGDKSAKMLVFADGTVFSDFLLRNPGNQLLVLDTFRFLNDKVKFSGNINSEEDVKILHSKKEDIVLFYGTVFLVPVLILVMGYVMTRRGRLKKEGA